MMTPTKYGALALAVALTVGAASAVGAQTTAPARNTDPGASPTLGHAPPTVDERTVVLFDGVCNLCNRSVRFIIKRDPEGVFRFAPLQSDAGVRLLEQFGLAQVEGGGDISGFIPVSLADGLLAFNEAFLFSIPGEGDTIRIKGTEVLTAGIPPGTPEFNQMELARHALKDYDYEWAKITLNTVAEDLLVQLQFDGKPAEPLPFIYDPLSGGFVRTAPGQPGSVFQGIRLDVNVTLPLNRMLRYRELF